MGVTSSITSPTVYSTRRAWLLWAMFVALRIFLLSLCQNPDMWFAGGSWKPYFSNTHRDPIRTHMSVAQSRCVLHSRVWMGLTDNWQMAEILTDWQTAYNLIDNEHLWRVLLTTHKRSYCPKYPSKPVFNDNILLFSSKKCTFYILY